MTTVQTIEQLLAGAVDMLGGVSATPRLDAELLLAHALGRSRTWLYTWSDRSIDDTQQTTFATLLAARSRGEPIGYLIGQREFYGLELALSSTTLIPRPDTETLVEQALACMSSEAAGNALDLGTGTGAIALALAAARPGWQLTGVDRVESAVMLAGDNARRLGIDNACFLYSDYFAALAGRRYAIIVSNPPYLAADDPHLTQGDVRFEPRSALVAANGGLADLEQLIQQAPGHLEPGGWLLLEHGTEQACAVRACFRQVGFTAIATHRDVGGRERVTRARWRHAASAGPKPHRVSAE